MNDMQSNSQQTEGAVAVRSGELLCADLKWDIIQIRKVRGVYMLMADDEILYVGQSSNIEYRIACHLQAGKIPFKWVKLAATRKRDMDAIEKHLIELHNPPYNHTHTERAHAARGPRIAKWLKAHNVSDQRPGDRDAKKNKSSSIAGFAASDG